MAALLRSARLLRSKPGSLLETACFRAPGSVWGRQQHGAVAGGVKFAVCPRQLRLPSERAPSCLLASTSGFVRCYAVATDVSDQSSPATKSIQSDLFLRRLYGTVKKKGRIPKPKLLSVFDGICKTSPSGKHALLLLQSCGALLPDVPPAERTELAHQFWDELEKLGAQYDVSHYNSLLIVYLQNEFKFSPMEFLAKMEAANVPPNQETYQKLIAAYCQNGDIDGAGTILGFMKKEDLPITEDVFNSLVTGHACAGDLESAKNILSVMQNAGIDPGPNTYVSLLNAYAQNGDMENLKATLEAAESADCSLMDRDIMQIIFTLAKAGHHQHTPEIIKRLRSERHYKPDVMNLCLNLITHGLEDTAFLVLKSLPPLLSGDESPDEPNFGSFFFHHCVVMGTSLEKLRQYCKELKEANLHSSPLSIVLSWALKTKNTDLSIEVMKMFKEQNMPLRPHFFWPLLTAHVKDKNTTAVMGIMKAMKDLGVDPDKVTLSRYVLPAFPSAEEGLKSLKEAGISPPLFFEIHELATHNLAELYSRLTEGSLNLSSVPIRKVLVPSFHKSTDVDSMVKITELLFQIERQDEDTSVSNVGNYFLYQLISSMYLKKVQAQEEKLRKYFNQLREQNITITLNIYRGIRNHLEAYHVPGLIKDVRALVDPKEILENISDSQSAPAAKTESTAVYLEKKLKETAPNILKRTLIELSAENNLQRALELKQQNEADMTAASYAILISLCCRHDNAEEALNLKRAMSLLDPDCALDINKYLELVKTLVKCNKMEEALDVLKEMKEKDVLLDSHHLSLFHLLNILVKKDEPDLISRLLKTIFTLGLTKPTSQICSPLITPYINRGDMPAALNATMECQKRYKCMPRFHDVIVGLMQQEDMERLQTAMNFASHERGEMAMLYDLFFAFLETGRYPEARKVIEQTPGFRAFPNRLQWFGEKCISTKQMKTLEQMVEITSDLFQCDRDEMYSFILRLCQETNDWQKAEAVWTKMQEENVVPRERTLLLLSDIFKSNNLDVPLERPKTWYLDVELSNKLSVLCKDGKSKEAYEELKDLEKKGASLKPASFNQVICSLLANGHMEDAMAVKDIATSHSEAFKFSETAFNLVIVTQCKRGKADDALLSLKSMLQDNHVPLALAISNLVQALGHQGSVAEIQEVEALIKGLNTQINVSSMLFKNNTVLAHIQKYETTSGSKN